MLRLSQATLLGATLAACGSGGDTGGSNQPPPSPLPPPAPPGVVTGVVQYEFPPPVAGCAGLDFDNVILRPIRRATVQLIDANSLAVLDATASDDGGNYTLNVAPQTDAFVRVRAELKSASPSWDVEVRNNVVGSNNQNPPALADRPLYTMDGTAFNSGDTGHLRNLTASTGWGGSSYTGVRAAAPFSVLDAIYSGMSLVLGDEPLASFAPLDAFWSPDNTTSASGEPNIDSGELGTSFYDGEINSLFLLGMDGADTEEFDDHVIVHEWGHYFEDVFSRSDSIGGPHGIGELLDMRVAFGEGFATALSGMALDDPRYCDSLWRANGNLTGFEIDIESEAGGTAGWYNESSVMKLIYDLWDVDDDLADDSSIGFRPIFDVMTGDQATTPAFTSIFTFITYLKQQGTGQETFIDALLTGESINPVSIDIYGSNETNDGPGSPPDVLPIYTELTPGISINICTNSQNDSGRNGNKLAEHRYLSMNLPAAQQVTFSMIASPAPSAPSAGFDCTADVNDPENHEHSDPDLIVWRNGEFVLWSIDCTPNTEISDPQLLPAGDYVIDINEFRYDDTDTPNPYPEQVCFDFSAN